MNSVRLDMKKKKKKTSIGNNNTFYIECVIKNISKDPRIHLVRRNSSRRLFEAADAQFPESYQ